MQVHPTINLSEPTTNSVKEKIKWQTYLLFRVDTTLDLPFADELHQFIFQIWHTCPEHPRHQLEVGADIGYKVLTHSLHSDPLIQRLHMISKEEIQPKEVLYLPQSIQTSCIVGGVEGGNDITALRFRFKNEAEGGAIKHTGA